MANKMIITGRLTGDPEVRYGGANNTAVARYSIASQRKLKDNDGNYPTDFIKCISFGKTAESIEKYAKKGTKLIILDAEFQNNNYTNKDGQKVYDYQVVVSSYEFAESKKSGSDNGASNTGNNNSTPAANNSNSSNNSGADDSFMDFSEIDDEELPFN